MNESAALLMVVELQAGGWVEQQVDLLFKRDKTTQTIVTSYKIYNVTHRSMDFFLF